MGTCHSGKTKLIQHFLQTDGIRQDLMKEGVFTTDVRMSRCVCTFTCAHTLHFLLHSLLSFPYSSCEDGRYKCKVVVDDCPRLLLIREDTGIPSHEVRSCGHVTWSCGGHVTWLCDVPVQFSNWLDALILVFSYHEGSSLTPMASMYQAFQEGRGQEVPILIVGTVGKQNGSGRVDHTAWADSLQWNCSTV